MMYLKLTKTITALAINKISENRLQLFQPLIDFIQFKVDNNEKINLNFICTHNSRRSHLAQVWAQVASVYYNVKNVTTYSGGTEETALYPKVAETLINQGLDVFKIAEGDNPIYAIKYLENGNPIIGFSKKYDNQFNPNSDFAAVLTCSQVDEGCPFILGAELRIPITYEDPKISDNSDNQNAVYAEGSLQIANEMFYVFSQIIK